MTPENGRPHILIPLGMAVLIVSGCIVSGLVPTDMEPTIMRQVTFEAVKAGASQYIGTQIVLGGKVLRAKLLKGQTQIELLQLPLDREDRPLNNVSASKGRFLALDTRSVDPATLPEGTLVSLVGEVTGSRTLPLDETEYTYPVVSVKILKTWPQAQAVYVYGSHSHLVWGPSFYSTRWGLPF